MKALLDGLKALGPARLAAMGAVGLGVMVLLATLALRGGQAHFALLYGDLDMRESAQIVDNLTRQHIAYQIVGNGGSIMVPIEDVGRARLLLAKDGLPSGGSVGYELFDRGDSLTTSQFQQQLNQARALEGELSRTIRTIDGVRGARVHLVLPKREPFQRERQDAQASVLLTMNGNARLDNQGVQAILNLVAAAVPGLRPQNISIIDNRGTMLARAGEALGGSAGSQGAEELRRQTEIRLARAVEEMLEQSVGPGRVRAEASVEMDYDRVNETQEKYDPEGKVERSTQSVTSSNKSTEKEASTSVQNNLPNADAGGGSQTGSQESKQEETTNFEIGRTVRTLVREQPSIKRLSIAVMVDGTDEPGADGKPVWKARSPDELARLTSLVQSAVGYNDKRGDRVEVASLRFAGAEEAAAEPAGLLGLHLDKPDIVRLAETLMIGVLSLLALLLVLRPMVNRLTLTTAGGVPALAGGVPGYADAIAAGGGAAGALAGPAGAARLAGGGAVPMLEDESMVMLANIEGQLRASSIRKIGELVERHPEETLTIVRTWLSQGQEQD